MRKIVRRVVRFASEDHGAVTVDWIVGAAAGVALALAITEAVGGGARSMAENLSQFLSDQEVGAL